MPEQKPKQPAAQPAPQGLTNKSLQQPEKPLLDEADDVIANLPMTETPDKVSGVKQVVVPNYRDAPDKLKKRFMRFDAPMGEGPSTRSHTDPAHEAECRKYLVEHDWEESFPGLWKDPLAATGFRGEKQVIRMLTSKDKKSEYPLMQLVVPPPVITYDMFGAVAVQRMRDAAEESKLNPTMMERLAAKNEEVVELRKLCAQMASELGAVNKRPVPNSVDALKAELMVLRRLALAASARLKADPQPEKEVA